MNKKIRCALKMGTQFSTGFKVLLLGQSPVYLEEEARDLKSWSGRPWEPRIQRKQIPGQTCGLLGGLTSVVPASGDSTAQGTVIQERRTGSTHRCVAAVVHRAHLNPHTLRSNGIHFQMLRRT